MKINKLNNLPSESGHLYRHDIWITEPSGSNNKYYIAFSIINDSNVAFTYTTLENYVVSNDLKIPCSGFVFVKGIDIKELCIYAFNYEYFEQHKLGFQVTDWQGGRSGVNPRSISSDSVITDTIIQLM